MLSACSAAASPLPELTATDPGAPGGSEATGRPVPVCMRRPIAITSTAGSLAWNAISSPSRRRRLAASASPVVHGMVARSVCSGPRIAAGAVPAAVNGRDMAGPPNADRHGHVAVA